MAKKSCSSEGSRSNAAISAKRTDNNSEENNGRVKYKLIYYSFPTEYIRTY